MDKYPEIQNLQSNIGLNIELADNGFSTGIRSLRDWENSIRYYASITNFKNITDFQNHNEYICRSINLKDSGKTEQNLLKWANNDPRGQLINDKQTFTKLFKPPQSIV